MKKIFILTLLSLIAVEASAQQVTNQLVGRGMNPTLAEYIGDALGDDDIVFTANPYEIKANTANGADTKRISICGGGACEDTGRGAYIVLEGLEDASAGLAELSSGSGAAVNIIAAGTGVINLRAGASNETRWTVENDGDLSGNATNGGNILLNLSGKTIAIEDDTAASTCKGTSTINGTTAVTITTTCAETGMHVSLTRTSDGSGTATNDQVGEFVTNIVNGTSFDLDATDAADSSTVSWVIIKGL